MTLLVIDTSGPVCGTAVMDREKVYSEWTAQNRNTHSANLMPMAEAALQSAGKTIREMDAIAAVTGPGSFTGIRMGIAYAKGLGIGLNIPVIGVNVFELYLYENPYAFVAIDSGRGDFFVASNKHEPCTMTIDEVEVEQMKCPLTVGHKPYNFTFAKNIVENKIKNGDLQPAIPMYLRPSYAEK